MPRDHTNDRTRRSGGPTTADAGRGTPGRTTQTASRYDVLRRALRASCEGTDSPTIHDVATAAVDGRGAGHPVNPSVRSKAEAHLGAHLGDVRVHTDELAQQASAAMGARAFAHKSDVFLGAAESPADTKLMAHELAHVVQQGAAGPAVQRQVQVGEANSPAETEADAVAEKVAGNAPSTQRLMDEGELQPGQMYKDAFVEQLRAAVTAAADEELGPAFSAIGCPYIDQYFARYGGRPAAQGEALLARYAPATRGATTAADMIPAVVARVRRGVRAWRDTGEPPTDFADTVQPASESAALPERMANKKPEPITREIGPGTQLDNTTASRMGSAFGTDFSYVRIHTDSAAQRKVSEEGAMALTVGSHVAFGAGQYLPGTPAGDALLAHELAHVVQQHGADNTAVPAQRTGRAHEEDADTAAKGVLARLYGGAKRVVGNVMPALSAGLSLQRCKEGKKQPEITNTFVLALEARLEAGDKAGFFTDLVALAGGKSGDQELDEGIGIFLNNSKLTLGEATRARVVQELGPDGNDAATGWPMPVRNFVDGVDGGEYSPSFIAIPYGRDALIEFARLAAGRTADGTGPLVDYRNQFNAKWDVPPHAGKSTGFGEALDSKGPRSARARSVFNELYAEPAIKTGYDTDTPAGYRDQCNRYVAPTGTNPDASPRLQALRTALEPPALTPVPATTGDAAYVALVSLVQPLAASLESADHQAIEENQQEWRAVYGAKLGGAPQAVISHLRSCRMPRRRHRARATRYRCRQRQRQRLRRLPLPRRRRRRVPRRHRLRGHPRQANRPS